ncbi:MAG: GntR family transcriptional regulator [Pseudomonadota bacterium]
MSEFLPRYARVRASLIERLASGEWAPGTSLPSEIALAAEMEVSQGTVRKAMDSLVADGALNRVQGRGTFVAEQTPELANFRFLRIVDGDGQRVIPELLSWTAKTEPADDRIAQDLSLKKRADLHRIDRIRAIDGTPALLETIRVPLGVMPGLGQPDAMPNALYPWYQSEHGVTVLRTDDRLRAVAADADAATALSVPAGTPLLECVRVAYDLTDRAVEHRISHILTNAHAFSVRLG